MSLDHQADLLAQMQRLERLENRICEVQRILQVLVVGESWFVKHVWHIVALVGWSGLSFMAGMAAVK